MTELCTKITSQTADIMQVIKNNGFEYKQSYITFETYFSHSQSVLNLQNLLENSVVIKHNQNSKQSYILHKSKTQTICTQIEDAKIAKQILNSAGLFAWCEYTLTNTIFDSQDIEINLCTVFEVGDFLKIKSDKKDKKQLVEIIKKMGIKTDEDFDINIGAEYYKKNYEENI